MTGITVREFNGKQIEQRTDGYMDATAMCKATGRKWSHYWEKETTKEFVAELANSTGRPVESLLESRTGRHGGTYVHPKMAMHLAQWCSPKFAVVVSGWVLDILTTGRVEVGKPTPPPPTPTPPVEVDPADPIMKLFEVVVMMRRAQLEQERRLATVEQKVDRALRVADAALSTTDSNYGWYSVLAWCNRTGRRATVAEAAKIGRKLSARMRAIGGEPKRVSDQRFGMVNLYPEAVLVEYFSEFAPSLIED